MRLNYIILLAFCGSLVCGYELVKVLEDAFPPLMMAAARALLAAMVIFLFCLIARQPLLPAFRRSAKLAVIGVLGFGTLYAMVTLGERHVDPELAMLLVCVVPITTLVITALPPNPKHIWWPAWIGTAVASLGLVVVIGPGADRRRAFRAVCCPDDWLRLCELCARQCPCRTHDQGALAGCGGRRDNVICGHFAVGIAHPRRAFHHFLHRSFH